MAKPEVVAIDLGVRWEPNAPDEMLIQNESDAWLILAPHFEDPDLDPVVLRWIHCWGALLGPPNDEARSGHPLWNRGLQSCLWAGEVIHSRWIADLEARNRVHPRHDPMQFQGLRHFVLLLHDSTFETIARDVEVTRAAVRTVIDRLQRKPT
jgi:hypothetical protein